MELLGRGGLNPHHLIHPSPDLTSSSDRPRLLALLVVRISFFMLSLLVPRSVLLGKSSRLSLFCPSIVGRFVLLRSSG
ncbi:unnamed protein product, partial [Ectocarpus sp. 6 AP-2014]